jgi:hypothetical protein
MSFFFFFFVIENNKRVKQVLLSRGLIPAGRVRMWGKGEGG